MKNLFVKNTFPHYQKIYNVIFLVIFFNTKKMNIV